MAGCVAMTSVFAVVGIEMFFASKGAAHSHAVDLGALGFNGNEDSGQHELRPTQRLGRRSSENFNRFRTGEIGRGDSPDSGHGHGSWQGSTSPILNTPGLTDKSLPDLPYDEAVNGPPLDRHEIGSTPEDADGDDTALLNGTAQKRDAAHDGGRRSRLTRNVSFMESPTIISTSNSGAACDARERRLVLQCLLLEAGILFHSVFIGMALSVASGSAFVVLLIAISFHQTFEGLALGSRIAAIPSFSTTSFQPWLMSAMYGVTTPIGQAIGLAVHGLYDPASQFGLLTVGLVNAISSGLLLYAGLVQLLAEDFLSDRSYVDLTGRRRLEACGAVVGGAMLMAAVGAFA